MKLKVIKTFNAVKVGNAQDNWFQSDKYDMTLEAGMHVRIVNKFDGSRNYTSLMNLPWYDFEEEFPFGEPVTEGWTGIEDQPEPEKPRAKPGPKPKSKEA